MSQSDFRSDFEMQQPGLLNTDAEMQPDISGAPEPPVINGHNQAVTPSVLTPAPPLASRNGHVSHHDRVADEPYVLDVFPTSGELAKDHREQLKTESGLSDEPIDARGYFTCDDREVLKHHGFPPNLGRCLMIPTFNWRGERVGMIARPDIPLGEPNGKTRKYLLPANAPPVLDVAPLTRQHIDDPRVPLLITEGAKKADAGASRGLAMINLNGVYGFRGKNLKGGLTALSDWENIALKGSMVPGGPVEGRAAARTWLSLPKGFVMPDTTPTPANIAAAKNFILGISWAKSPLMGQPAEATGDWRNVKGDYYHLLYAIWLLLHEEDAQVAFYQGNDLLAVVPEPRPPESDPTPILARAQAAERAARNYRCCLERLSRACHITICKRCCFGRCHKYLQALCSLSGILVSRFAGSPESGFP